MAAGRTAVPARIGALRRWADTTLFLEAPPAAPLTAERLLIAISLAAAGVAIVLLRLGGVPLDSVWAEDGPIFLGEALDAGFPDPVFTNYAGYLHLVPRLLAEVAALAPLDWAAEVLAVSGALVAVVCAFVVWEASAGHLRDPRLRAVMAAMVLLLPVVGEETLANITYVQWLMFLPTFWLLLWRPTSASRAAAGAAFVAVTLMSAPLALFLAPIAALRALAIRDSRDLMLVAGFALGAGAQTVAILVDDSTQPPPGWDPQLLTAYLLRVVGGLIFGQPAEVGLWELTGSFVLVVSGLALAAIVAFASLRPTPGRALSLLAVALSIVLFLFPTYRRDVAGALMWSPGESNTLAARYTIVPALMVLTALLVQLQHWSPSIRQPIWTRLRVAVIALISVAALSSFYVGDLRRQTGWSDALDESRAVCERDRAVNVSVPTSPPGWTLDLRCAELGE